MAPPTPTSVMLVTGEYFDHLAPDPTHEVTGGGARPRPSHVELIERFMPLVAPRPGECWRPEVEALLT